MILHKESVSELENSSALIRQETICQTTLKGESENSDSTTIIARNRNGQGQIQGNHLKVNSNTNKSKFKCTQCNKRGHTKSHCFELNGYPEWWDHSLDQRRKNPTLAVIEAKIIDETSSESTALMTIRSNH